MILFFPKTTVAILLNSESMSTSTVLVVLVLIDAIFNLILFKIILNSFYKTKNLLKIIVGISPTIRRTKATIKVKINFQLEDINPLNPIPAVPLIIYLY